MIDKPVTNPASPLPAHPSAVDPAVEATTTPAPMLSIIAMDDDEDFRQYITGVLRQQGHDVRAVGTADEFFATC